MREIDKSEWLMTLRIWLTLVPQGVRRDFAAKRQETRDRAVEAMAAAIGERMRDHAVHAPDLAAWHSSTDHAPPASCAPAPVPAREGGSLKR